MSKQNNVSRKLALDSPDRKRSVFERLGTKSSSSSSSSAPGKNVCHSWAQNGTCSLNKTCKYAHTHVLISPSKRSKAEAMKKQSLVVQKRTGKEDHKKSSRSHQCTEAEWEGWELGDLEEADEKALERRKQELQRELQLQLKKEKELTRKKEKRNDKKRASSSSSSSTSTTESSSSTTSSSSSSSEPRKRQGRKRKHGSTSFESDVSSHRPRKSPKTVKVKVSSSKKGVEKKDGKSASEARSKSGVVVTKKTVLQKKSTSPVWDKSRARTPHSKQQPQSSSSSSKKASPHQSPADSKNKSPSPRYDRSLTKTKTRTSPKLKAKEPASPKRTAKKVKESSVHAKDKMRQSPAKSRSSPGRVHKVSPSRSRRHEDGSDKRRGHYEDRKHSPRRERSRDKERKREVRRGHSNENDNGGLKKGGKILPLKPSSYAKDNGLKSKESSRRKSSEKTSDAKSKDLDCDKDKVRTDRDKDRSEKDKAKSERDKVKHKKGSDAHDRHSGRDRDADRASLRSRDDRNRDRDAERVRIAKEREAERQKERDEALERCRERQRERERLEKERKEKEEKKHQSDGKQKECDRELPSLLDLKTENPRGHGDSNNSKSSDKHSQRDARRNLDKGSEKQPDRDGRDRERLLQRSQGSPSDKDHDRREPRRSDDNERRQSDKDYDLRRNRESDVRHATDLRRAGPLNRRAIDDPDCRRPWDDIRRVLDSSHDRRRILDPGLEDRRSLSLLRRAVDEPYDYRRGHDDPDLDVRDFPPEDRRGRKLLHGFHHDGQDWDPKNPDLEYRDAELRDEWNHPDRHHDWAVRYDHKWLDREDTRDSVWNHYSRRPAHDDWNSDWVGEDQTRSLYREPNEDQLGMLNEGFADHNGRRHNDVEGQSHLDKDQPIPASSQPDPRWEKTAKAEGDALSDISDDPDDILNQEDETNETGATAAVAPAASAATTTATAAAAAAAATTPAASESAAHNATASDGGGGAEPTAAAGTAAQNQQIYVRNNEFFFDQRRPLLECFGERALDFEEISDEELEEEARAGKGIMDVLGADWAGLIKDVRPRSKRADGPVVAHRRWMFDKLVSRIGISVKYAGKDFARDLVEKYREVKEEARKDADIKAEKVKEEEEEVVEEEEDEEEDNNSAEEKVKEEKGIAVNVTVKIEAEDADVADEERADVGINLFHDVPALHNSLRECKNYRASLFLSHNRFKRALSARTDLSLRRELCNLPPKEPLHFTPPLDNKMYENSVKLFQRG